MNRIKAYPLFTALLALCALLVATELWWTLNRSAAAERSERSLNQAMSRLQDFSRVTPAPENTVAEQLEQDRIVAGEAVEKMRAALAGQSPLAQQIKQAKPPAQRADAFFDIARFVEAQRNAARTAGIELKADEMFGFATYRNTGPEPELIPVVYRQRLVAEYLLQAAFAARPLRFDGLERTLPSAPGAPSSGSSNRGGNRATETDYFQINPQVSARREGFVRTTPMRVRFSGQTSALRAFLNRLSLYELPLLVRSVEVEPATQLNQTRPTATRAAQPAADPFGGVFGGGNATPGAAPAADVPVPIVSDNYSRFTITVEYLELQATGAADAAEGETP